MGMLKLYGAARSRASIVQWWLEELGVPYEFVELDLQAGEQKQPDYLAINPFGKVPAIVDTVEGQEIKLWESGAILLYVDRQYVADRSESQRAIDAQWVVFANASLGPGVFSEASRERETPRLLGGLNEIFSQQAFLTGDSFSVADVAVASMLFYMPLMLKIDFSPYPGITKYLGELAKRPAFQTAIGSKYSAS